MTRSISRRALLGAAGLAMGAVAAGGSAAAQEELKESEKIKQTDAHYQDHPKGQQRCEICLQFTPPNTCKIVQGPVTATGWCQFFAAKENAH